MTFDENGGRHDLAKCGAKKRQGEGVCGRPAGWGTSHVGVGACKLHGGATKTQTVAAERQVAEVEARRVLAELDVQAVTDPLAALMRLAGQVLAWQEATSALVNRLESVRYQGANGTEQLRAEVQLYERSMDRAVTVLAAIGRLNIDERLAKVAEQQAAQLAQALRLIFQDLGLTAEQRALVPAVVPRRLREVARQAREGGGAG